MVSNSKIERQKRITKEVEYVKSFQNFHGDSKDLQRFISDGDKMVELFGDLTDPENPRNRLLFYIRTRFGYELGEFENVYRCKTWKQQKNC